MYINVYISAVIIMLYVSFLLPIRDSGRALYDSISKRPEMRPQVTVSK